MIAFLRRHRGAVFGLLLLAALVFLALFAPLVSPRDPVTQDLERRLEPPGHLHWLGTDHLGRDVLSRIMYGARISLLVGVSSTALALVLGVVFGLISGYYGGWVDHAVMGCLEALMAFPSMLLAIAIVAILGPSLPNATLAIALVSVPLFARLTRGQVLSVKELEYVQSAKAIGSPDWRILFLHILPNCSGPLVVQIALGIGGAILDLAGLSFLGLGAQPPMPEWGSMLSDTVRFLEKAPWIILFPGLMITLSVLAFNLVGDGLRDFLDPRSRLR